MHSKVLAASLAAASLVSAATPPGFEPKVDKDLDVVYSMTTPKAGNVQVKPAGRELRMSSVMTMPSLAVSDNTASKAANDKQLVVMIDLDAPFADKNRSMSQILHWMQPGVSMTKTTTTSSSGDSNKGSKDDDSNDDKERKYRRKDGKSKNKVQLATNMTSQAAIAGYISPSPPAGSDAHRYVILLYNQKTTSQFAPPASFAGFNAMNRTKFDVANFQKAAGLSDPIAANWFLVRPGDNSTSMSSGMNSGSSSSSGSGSSGKGGSNSTGKGSGLTGAASNSSNSSSSSNSSNPETFQGAGVRSFGGVSLFAIDAAVLGAVWFFFFGAL